MNSTAKRITIKRKQPNPLFQEWLEELYEDAKTKHSKLESMLKEALTSISKYPLPLQTGAECAVLKGFDKRLCVFLDRRLEVYNGNCDDKQNTEEAVLQSRNISQSSRRDDIDTGKSPEKFPQAHNSNCYNINNNLNCNEVKIILTKIGEPSSAASSTSSDNSQKASTSSGSDKNGKKDRIYKPTFRSGAYAILVGLLENYQECPQAPSLTKEALIERAQKHSEESFTRPKPESFYTAWSNITRLITKELVQKCKKKKVEYTLTDSGVTLAMELLKTYANTPSVNDIIFNNKQMETEISNCPPNSTDACRNLDVINANVESIEMPAGSFDVILLIDKQETSGNRNCPTVAQFDKYPDLKHEYRSLKVGDFTWIARHRISKEELVLPYIIERKRMDDLGSSIKDGRFHEQKFRLRKCGLKNVIYMVEDYGKNKHVGLPLQSLMQAMANTRVQDHFKVHTTNSLSNSARFLAMMTKRLTIQYKDRDLKGSNRESQNGELMTFKYFNTSSAKSKPLTVTEAFIKLLLQLKGLSVEKAVAVTNVYSTPSLLMKEYQKCDEKEAEFLLANLKYGELNRNVGPTVSKAIYQLFT